MMRVEKIVPPYNMSVEDAVNEFFLRENLGRANVVHIRPVVSNNRGSVSDVVAVYVFYDKCEAYIWSSGRE